MYQVMKPQQSFLSVDTLFAVFSLQLWKLLVGDRAYVSPACLFQSTKKHTGMQVAVFPVQLCKPALARLSASAAYGTFHNSCVTDEGVNKKGQKSEKTH